MPATTESLRATARDIVRSYQSAFVDGIIAERGGPLQPGHYEAMGNHIVDEAERQRAIEENTAAIYASRVFEEGKHHCPICGSRKEHFSTDCPNEFCGCYVPIENRRAASEERLENNLMPWNYTVLEERTLANMPDTPTRRVTDSSIQRALTQQEAARRRGSSRVLDQLSQNNDLQRWMNAAINTPISRPTLRTGGTPTRPLTMDDLFAQRAASGDLWRSITGFGSSTSSLLNNERPTVWSEEW